MTPVLRLRLVGAVLLLAAVATPWLLPALAPVGADGPETVVDGDGSVVTVPVDGTTMLWFNEGSAEPTCDVSPVDGSQAVTARVDDGPRRAAKAGDDVGTYAIETDGRSVAVSCSGASALVAPEPHAVSGWAAVALVGVVALALAAAGLGCLAAASRRRPAQTSPAALAASPATTPPTSGPTTGTQA